jgi:DNA-binding FrmR family transcriptional regulator
MSATAHDHAMGIAEPTKADLLKRLARIRGQVDGIRRMVEDERYCPEILQQFAAVRAGLASAEKELFANHLEGCATHGLAQGGDAAREVRQELLDLFYRYMR